MPIVEQFDRLVERGLKVIPLRENSKVPLMKGWLNWNYSEIRERLKVFPDCNLGLILGEIIDVEGDDEHANNVITDLIGNYQHPCYSSTKSVHHLFKTPDPSLRIFCYENIEFRGHGHQSVLPPSQHNGVNYEWISERPFPVPEMPEKLLRFFQSKRNNKKVKPGHRTAYCSICQKKVYLHRKRFDFEFCAFQDLGMKWQCLKCRDIKF